MDSGPVCYSLPVRDFHSLPLADLPAHIAVSASKKPSIARKVRAKGKTWDVIGIGKIR
jgi:hypothetical protein